MEKIEISESHILRAKKYAEESLDYTYDRFKLSTKERHEKILIGKIGEEIIKDLFERNNLLFEVDQTSAKEVDNFDFTVKCNKIDVKTCSEDFHKLLLVVKEKFDTYKKHDFYIGVKINMAKMPE